MQTTNQALTIEARRNLEGYIATGINGLFAKAIDRLAATGMRVSQFEATTENAKFLLNHLSLHRLA